MVHSFEIHIVQCRELFEKREQLKPVKERRRVPDDPLSFKRTNQNDLNTINDMSFKSFNDNLSPPCENCGRTFLPEKLIIHMRSCRVPQRTSLKEANSGAQRNDRNNNIQSPRISKAYNPRDEMQGFSDYAELMKCSSCGRTFNEFSYPKHVKICKKVFCQKRKQFDSSKKRAEGTELMNFRRTGATVRTTGARVTLGQSKQPAVNNSSQQMQPILNRNPTGNGNGYGNVQSNNAMPKWKADSNAFRQAMRAARAVSKAEVMSKKTGIPLHALMPTSYQQNNSSSYSNPGYVTCPTCNRSYSETAGARHIPQCKNIINKPKALLRGGSSIPAAAMRGSGQFSNSTNIQDHTYQPSSNFRGFETSPAASAGSYHGITGTSTGMGRVPVSTLATRRPSGSGFSGSGPSSARLQPQSIAKMSMQSQVRSSAGLPPASSSSQVKASPRTTGNATGFASSTSFSSRKYY